MKKPESLEAGGTSGWRIALLNETDLPRVVAIEQESHLEPWSRESFLAELRRPISRVWVAYPCVPAGQRKTETAAEETSGAFCQDRPHPVAGYLCCWLVADELQILNVTVDKKWRRRGIGRVLLAHALNWGGAQNAQTAVLEVRKSNRAAQLLYKNMGFHTVGERPDYYGVVRESAVLMERDLSNEQRT